MPKNKSSNAKQDRNKPAPKPIPVAEDGKQLNQKSEQYIYEKEIT